MTRTEAALDALGSLLDRSLVQITAASADARTYDRRTIYKVADVWDNNTFPLFHATTAPISIARERRARAALAWMARFGPERRNWMIEQAEAAGRPLERLLPPPVAEPMRSRDYRGLVTPPFMPLTAEAALELGTDYDLATTEISALHLERGGTRLIGSVVLAAPRRYEAGVWADQPPWLHLSLEDVTDVRFDSGDLTGVTLDHETGGIVIGLGAGGRLRATGGTVYVSDQAWHLSTAGRAADQRTPPRDQQSRRSPERRRPLPEGAALVAATIVHSMMLQIRMVRYAEEAARVPVRLLARTIAGAGTDIIAAGALRGDRREMAFRDLVETWITRGGPALSPWFADRLADSKPLPDTTGKWIDGLTAAGAALPEFVPAPAPPLPAKAELRLAEYTAARLPYRGPQDPSALVLLAHPAGEQDPPDRPWRLRALKVDGVSRFRLRTDAFDRSLALRTAGEKPSVESLVLGHDALDVRGRNPQP
ncbi:hypothetical protein [Sphaerimonospora mesophila]|uniref:hypothetical protein n=1 Tax=Sphaerimonospora mesophila TaxID=37483 RepID=UPI0006E3D286